MSTCESYDSGSPASPIVVEALNRSAQISKIILDASRSKDGIARIDSVWHRYYSANSEHDSMSDNGMPLEPQEHAPNSPNQLNDSSQVTSYVPSNLEASMKSTERSRSSAVDSSSTFLSSRRPALEQIHKNQRQKEPLQLEDLALGPITEEQIEKAELPILQQELGALILKKGKVVQATFGVGLQVSTEVPHIVQGADRIILVGNSSSKIEVGDTLVGVDGKLTQTASIDIIESLICGEKDTYVPLVLRSCRTGQLYEVNLRRHVCIRISERTKCWYELKPGVQSLSASTSIVTHLEDIRNQICCYQDGPLDYLNKDKHGSTSLGLLLSVASSSSQSEAKYFVQHIIPGTSADVDGGLIIGDELIAINGVRLSNFEEEAVMESLRGKGFVGSTCTLMIRRHDEVFHVELTRMSHNFVNQSEQLFFELDKHIKLVNNAPTEELQSSVRQLKVLLRSMQRSRIREDMNLANRLLNMQLKVIEHLTEAEKCLAPMVTDPDSIIVSKVKDHAAEGCMKCLSINGSANVNGSRDDLLEEIENLKAEISQKTELVRLQAFELKTLRAELHLQAEANNNNTQSDIAAAALRSSKIYDSRNANTACPTVRPDVGEVNGSRISASQVNFRRSTEAIRAPTIFPKGGTFEGAVNIRITSADPNAIIYCTRDNTDPSSSNYAACGNSPLLIELQHSAAIKCVAILEGKLDSPVSYATYEINRASSGGIGVLIESEPWNPGGKFVVKELMDGGPAARCGKIMIGDALQKIDDQNLKNFTLQQVLDLIKGPEDSTIKLEVTRPKLLAGQHTITGLAVFALELRRSKLPS